MDKSKYDITVEYQKAAEQLSELLDFSEETKRKIDDLFQRYGIDHFFNNFESYDFSFDTINKLKNLILILNGFGDKIQKVGSDGKDGE